jgi:ADP-dependent phosphofructokinase/glucokinase
MLSLHYRGYGQVRELYLEDIQMGDPSLVLQAPNITISQADIMKNLEKTLKLFLNENIRKRFIAINFSHGTYIIGGYEYIAEEHRRQMAKYDYFYHTNLDKLISIKPLPDGRVSFAACTDGRYIICAGG